MGWGWIARKLIPRSSPQLRDNDIYRWTNRIVWLLVAFMLVVALLLIGFEGR